MLKTNLGRATFVVVAVHLAHDLDHVRQGGRESTGELVPFLAVLAWVATIALVVLVARRDRFAPALALFFGLSFTGGFVLVHLLPDWGAFSDSYQAFDPDVLSWVMAALPMAAGLWLAYEGYRNLSSTDGRTSAALPGPA